MQQILIALSELAWDAAKEEILLEGQNNLLHHREFEENAFELLEFLGRGEPMSQLLATSSGPLRVIIGRETPFEELKNSSLIIARYTISGGPNAHRLCEADPECRISDQAGRPSARRSVGRGWVGYRTGSAIAQPAT